MSRESAYLEIADQMGWHEPPILNAHLASRRNSMEKFFKDREAIVRSVRKQLKNLAVGSQLTITIEREKFGEYFVTGAINSSSDDTQTPAS